MATPDRASMRESARPHTCIDGAAEPCLVPAVSLLAVSAALLPRAAKPAEPPPLDEEFLEYLAQLEDNEDDWTWFEAEDPQPAAPPAAAAKPPATKPPAGKTPPSKTSTGERR